MTVAKRDGQRGGAQFHTIIPEPDLYQLIKRSKMPAAKEFQAWVTEEVLPPILKTGPKKLGISPNKLMPVFVPEPQPEPEPVRTPEPEPQAKMSNLLHKVFDFNGYPLTTITDENGQPWFVAKEVCDILGYANSRKAIADHCNHSKKMTVTKRYGQRGGAQFQTIIPESDLYNLINASRMPAAIAFRDWVAETVLPTIRKTGGYTTAPQIEETEYPRKTRYIEGVTREYKTALRSTAAVLLTNSRYLQSIIRTPDPVVIPPTYKNGHSDSTGHTNDGRNHRGSSPWNDTAVKFRGPDR